MPERPGAGGGEGEVLSGASTLHRLRIGDTKSHEPLLLQPRKRRVDRANGDGSPGARFDLASNRDAVCGVALVREREHHVKLEFADEIAFGHICSTNEYLDGSLSGELVRR